MLNITLQIISMVPLLWSISFFIAIYVMLRYRKRISHKSFVSFVIFAAVTVLAIALQYYFYGFYFITVATSICALVLYLFVATEGTDMHLKQERENDKLKVEVMLSQIQPHFLFNSLTVIKHLCRRDPEVAEKAISDFSQYLRANTDSLNTNAPIPFINELKHTKAYLSLEKLRFDDALQIEYDIQCSGFYLPALTLQPITENAVRHGVRGTENGRGTVKIASREYEDRYEVTVSDDGKGFDIEQLPGSDVHIGINNVRYRLKNMCGGNLTIGSAEKQGTVAVISVPKGENHASLRDR